jgi:hypothetical protein
MIHNHEDSLLSPPDGGRGTDTCGVVMPNEAAMPGDTGWSPKANGTVEFVLDDGPGAFCAPRTLVAEPRGALHRAAVFAFVSVVTLGLRRLVPW